MIEREKDNVLIAPMSVGKGCVKKPIDYILADIKEADQPNRVREAEWKRKNPPNKTKAKNSDIGQSTSYWVSGTSIMVSIASLLYNILRR